MKLMTSPIQNKELADKFLIWASILGGNSGTPKIIRARGTSHSLQQSALL